MRHFLVFCALLVVTLNGLSCKTRSGGLSSDSNNDRPFCRVMGSVMAFSEQNLKVSVVLYNFPSDKKSIRYIFDDRQVQDHSEYTVYGVKEGRLTITASAVMGEQKMSCEPFTIEVKNSKPTCQISVPNQFFAGEDGTATMIFSEAALVLYQRLSCSINNKQLDKENCSLNFNVGGNPSLRFAGSAVLEENDYGPKVTIDCPAVEASSREPLAAMNRTPTEPAVVIVEKPIVSPKFVAPIERLMTCTFSVERKRTANGETIYPLYLTVNGGSGRYRMRAREATEVTYQDLIPGRAMTNLYAEDQGHTFVGEVYDAENPYLVARCYYRFKL